MARPLRIVYPNAVYHVMNRGLAKNTIFLNKDDYKNFLEILEDSSERWQARIYAYCLMGNHYHLCLRTLQGNLSRLMRHINGVYL